jgi:hypothetical protein
LVTVLLLFTLHPLEGEEEVCQKLLLFEAFCVPPPCSFVVVFAAAESAAEEAARRRHRGSDSIIGKCCADKSPRFVLL